MPSALLIVDVQHGLCHGDYAAFDIAAVIERINALSREARRAGLPVVVVQHEEAGDLLEFGSEAWQVDARVVTADSDLHVRKTAGNAFHGTPLQTMLDERGVDRVVVCGLQSDQCIAATARGAVELGYSVLVVADAHSTVDQDGSTAAEVSRHVNAALAAAYVHIVAADGLHVDGADFKEMDSPRR